MSRSDTDRHLVRADAEDVAGLRHLSRPTGMNRLRVEEHRLAAGGEVQLAAPPAGEGFIYVLGGQGRLTAGGETESVGTGDFIALAPGESVRIHNPRSEPLKVLLGIGAQGAPVAAQQQQ